VPWATGTGFDQQWAATEIPSQELLVALAQGLPQVWNTSTDFRLKQRIIHLVLREIIADFDAQSQAVTLILHWAGGRHSELRWIKNTNGWPGRGPVSFHAREHSRLARPQVHRNMQSYSIRTAPTVFPAAEREGPVPRIPGCEGEAHCGIVYGSDEPSPRDRY
jgi:hypothetical protein